MVRTIVVTLIAAGALFAGEASAKPATLTGDLPRRTTAAMENTPGLETEYGAVKVADGVRLRAFLTRPERAKGPLPAIFLVQWVSCGSLEFRDGRPSQLRDLARASGMVLIRVERAGTGDSEGPACEKLDHDTEVAHYRAALASVARHPWVDPKRIVLYGSSLGASNAPLVAEGYPVAGIIGQGGGGLSYLERMIHFDSLNLERGGKIDPAQFTREMARRVAFQHAYLIGRKTPAAVAAAHPELAGVWESLLGTEPQSHYGRPFAWHWQIASRDLLGAWTRVKAPVFIIYGEYDQYETRRGHRIIVDTLNALRPGSATWLEIPRASHDLDLFASPFAAYRDEGGRRDHALFVKPVVKWLKRVMAR